MPVLTADRAAVSVAPLAGRRILVADDDPVCLELTAGVLRDAGAEVVPAPDGRQAVLAVSAAVPDLVVTDLDMPTVDGLAAANILRWDLGLVDLAVIVVTAGPLEPAGLLAAGVNACLRKPVADEDLLAAVASCLQARLTPPATSRATTSATEVFDPADALARMGGRTGLLQRMVEVFAAEHGNAAGRIGAALARSDDHTARRICHALRGTGASLGARRLWQQAAACEEVIGQENGAPGPALNALRTTLAATLAAMAVWRTGA